MIAKMTSLTAVPAQWEQVMWHASHDALLPLFTTKMISVVKNVQAEYSDAQAYTWGVAMA